MREFEVLLGYADRKSDIYDNRWKLGGGWGNTGEIIHKY